MRTVYFFSLEKICPEESGRYKWVYNGEFLNGWREEVSNIWASIKDKVNR